MEIEDALTLGRSLLVEHGLHDWTVVTDRARTRAGACRAATRQISISRPITELHSTEEVRRTLLHEIAHALVGPRHGHDAVWRATAMRIGAGPDRTLPADSAAPQGEWTGTCPAGHTSHRHRRPSRVSSCRHCSPAFAAEHLLTWTFRGREVDLGAAYRAELRSVLTGAPPPAALTLGVGAPVRLLGSGRYAGLGGRIVKRGRSRYQVQTPRGVVSAPFALVEPLR